MNAPSIPCTLPIKPRMNADKIGVIASVLCAIHCGGAPFLLLLAPTFGKIWAHPASHWIVALLVVPLAGIMLVRGFQKHRKNWIIGFGSAGILLILVGAALPYWGDKNQSVGEHQAAAATQATACEVDHCCPSLASDATGNTQLHIPPASIATTLGGILLICAHIGNLRNCKACLKCEAC